MALRLKDEGNQGTLMELRARLEGARAASSATWTSRSPGSAADGSIRVVRPLFRGRD